jgi:hypothetical protein
MEDSWLAGIGNCIELRNAFAHGLALTYASSVRDLHGFGHRLRAKDHFNHALVPFLGPWIYSCDAREEEQHRFGKDPVVAGPDSFFGFPNAVSSNGQEALDPDVLDDAEYTFLDAEEFFNGFS